jgi:hypothetical protein
MTDPGQQQTPQVVPKQFAMPPRRCTTHGRSSSCRFNRRPSLGVPERYALSFYAAPLALLRSREGARVCRIEHVATWAQPVEHRSGSLIVGGDPGRFAVVVTPISAPERCIRTDSGCSVRAGRSRRNDGLCARRRRPRRALKVRPIIPLPSVPSPREPGVPTRRLVVPISGSRRLGDPVRSRSRGLAAGRRPLHERDPAFPCVS